MVDQQSAIGLGAVLRRPVIHPDVSFGDRVLLTAPGTFLTPANGDRPARRRDFLPADPDTRGTTIDGAVIGLVAAGFVAVAGTIPLAIGVLVFQGPVAWQSAASHYALLLAGIIAVVTAVVFGVRIARFGQLNGHAPAEVAARTHHGRYLTAADFDPQARALLRRTQDAVDAVVSSVVYRDALVDRHAVRVTLAEQEWDIALALREQARLRAKRAELSAVQPGALAEAAQLAEASVTRRVQALEHYAAEIRAADAAYRDWQRATALAELDHQHLDMVARTAADEYGIAELEAMSQRARAIRRALREPRD